MLQLPKRIALPLMLVSAALHWLCSQAIFLVSIDFDTSAGRVTYANGTDYDEFYDTIDVSDQEYITCGYSPIAIIFTVSLGVFMVLAALFMALRKFKTAAMPVAGSCSASISACCHVLSNDEPEPDTGEDAGLLGSQYPLGTGRRGNSSYSVASSWDDDRRSSRRTSGYSSTWEADIKTEHEIGTEAALLPVKWGVTETMIGDSSQTVGHCAFSSREVREPQQGKRFGYM